MFNNAFSQTKKSVDAYADFQDNQLKDAKAKGKSLGEQGLPEREGDTLAKYIGSLTAAFKNFLSQQVKPYEGNLDRLAQTERDTLNSKKVQDEKKLEKLNQNRRTVQVEKDRLPDFDYSRQATLTTMFVLLILAGAEGAFAHPAFQLFERGSNIAQYMLLGGLTVFFFFLPRACVGIYRNTEDSPLKIYIRVGAAAIIFSGFYVLACMRSAYLQNIDQTSMSDIHAASSLPLKPWFFMAISTLFLLVGCYMSYMEPTKDDRKTNRKAKELDAKLVTLDEEIKGVEDDLSSLPDKLYSCEQRLSRQQVEKENIRQRVTSMYQEAITTMLAENAIYRADNNYPSCAADPLLPLF